MRGMTADRLAHQRRLPTQPTMSNSVPSTPLQQPRDLRFHSRSPSPSRHLSNNSPRSVVSEAVGSTAGAASLAGGVGNAGGASSLRAAAGVCRFESGAEIRKRRIPYVDGGNEELGPPKKEPKKTLQPAEREKLSGDMRELYDRLLPSDESEDRRARLVTKLGNILNQEYAGGGISVNVFGSSGNLLSSSDSDVDICITTPLKRLDMHSLAELLHKNGMENVVCRASAKVPIVKCWDPELDLATDLNVNNTLALDNTRMIKTYVQLDDRVRPLAKIIKYWTKRRILNDAAFGGTISSYTWICMIISFLQRRDPPILPALQKIKDKRRDRSTPGGSTEGSIAEESSTDTTSEAGDAFGFADDIEALRGFGDANKETQADLLFHFFRHYGYEFDYSQYVVSIKEGRLLSRKEKGWDPSNYADKEARNRLCVEEPFTVNRNLGNSADDYAWSGIHGEIRRAFDLLADGCQLEKCCEQFEFPPEETKPVFQRPPPKPKPTLTRSASQSGRPGHETGSTRQRRPNNRNASSQRAGNRRASSGATFSNQRIPLPYQSPNVGAPMDYFGVKGTLHDHLASHWQMLQNHRLALQTQQEALSRRVSEQQVTHAQKRAGDLAASPRHGGRSWPDGLSSPAFSSAEYQMPTAPPLSAPLPPGYLYHYPSLRFAPPPSPMTRTRPREGTSTNPSSPSLAAAMPALRRQSQRAAVPEGPSGSLRSQSQPGRPLPPHPLTMPLQPPPPATDLANFYAGHFPSTRQLPHYIHSSPIPQMPFTPLSPMPNLNHPIETPVVAKEYFGWHDGKLAQIGPQFTTDNGLGIRSVALRDPPTHRPGKRTPDLSSASSSSAHLNGRRASRSPSPLSHVRASSTLGDLQASQHQMPFFPRPVPFDAHHQSVRTESPSSMAGAASESESGGPLIVNGSGVASQKPAEMANGRRSRSTSTSYDDLTPTTSTASLPRVTTMPIRKLSSDMPLHEQADITETPPRISPSPRNKPNARLNLSSHPNGNGSIHHHSSIDGNGNGSNLAEPFHHHPHLLETPIQAPLLSPVAEMRTPSPTHSGAFERDSPQTNGLMRATKIANAAKQQQQAGIDFSAGVSGASSPPLLSSPAIGAAAAASNHVRKGSAPNPIAHTLASTAAKSPTMLFDHPLPDRPLSQERKQAQQDKGPSPAPPSTNSQHPPPSDHLSAPPPPLQQSSVNVEKNPWQQAPSRKGHKKSRSSVSALSSGDMLSGGRNGFGGGQPLPSNENERKGG